MALLRKTLTNTDTRRALEIPRSDTQKLKSESTAFEEGGAHTLFLFDGTTLSEVKLCFRQQRYGTSFIRENKWIKLVDDHHLKPGDLIETTSIDVDQLPTNLADEVPDDSIVWRITAKRDGRLLDGFQLAENEDDEAEPSNEA